MRTKSIINGVVLLIVCVFLEASTGIHSSQEGPCNKNDCNNVSSVSLDRSLVWGPGLRADFWVPVRYFYVQLVDNNGDNMTVSAGKDMLTASVFPDNGERARIWTQVMDRHDGSYVIRFKMFSSTSDLQVVLHMRGRHLAGSPYIIPGQLHHEDCDCPQQTADQWAAALGCSASYAQIREDLDPWEVIDMRKVAKAAVERFNIHGAHSICHYKVIRNKIYRKCYGEHVGFNMFSDAILLSLTRKMQLPDVEFFMNLGDWPLEDTPLSPAHPDDAHSGPAPLPIISWCGSTDTRDIVLPTYDLTEATLEMMGRVSLDMFSVSANTGPSWGNKTDKAFWRGRDSRRERLKLVQMSRNSPDQLDARLTNMFFFPKDDEKYGAISPSISFFDFFKYKYQLNIDGTVAAYRFPYLLAGDALVFKQESTYYEHFYSMLEEGVHYIGVKHDLSDLLDKVKWAQEHDVEAQEIAKNGQQFARQHLEPAHVLCYHVRLLQEYAKRLKDKPKGTKGFTLVEQTKLKGECRCPSKKTTSKKKKNTHREEL